MRKRVVGCAFAWVTFQKQELARQMEKLQGFTVLTVLIISVIGLRKSRAPHRSGSNFMWLHRTFTL